MGDRDGKSSLGNEKPYVRKMLEILQRESVLLGAMSAAGWLQGGFGEGSGRVRGGFSWETGAENRPWETAIIRDFLP